MDSQRQHHQNRYFSLNPKIKLLLIRLFWASLGMPKYDPRKCLFPWSDPECSRDPHLIGSWGLIYKISYDLHLGPHLHNIL